MQATPRPGLMLELLGILRDQLRRIGGNCPIRCADLDHTTPKVQSLSGAGGARSCGARSGRQTPFWAVSAAGNHPAPLLGPAAARFTASARLPKTRFRSSLVEHVVLNTGFAKVGFNDAELRLGALAIGRHDRHLARGDRTMT